MYQHSSLHSRPAVHKASYIHRRVKHLNIFMLECFIRLFFMRKLYLCAYNQYITTPCDTLFYDLVS